MLEDVQLQTVNDEIFPRVKGSNVSIGNITLDVILNKLRQDLDNLARIGGTAQYVHIRYSNDGGKSFTANNGKTTGKYVGMYTDRSPQDSDDVRDYTWVLLQGKDGESVLLSFVFKRQVEKPEKPTPAEGTYPRPIPAGWSDGIPATPTDSPVWCTYRKFSSESGSANTDPEWADVIKLTDTSDFEVCYNSSKRRPPKPIHHGNQDPTVDNGWTSEPTDSAVWMATSLLSSGKWSNWVVTQISGESGTSPYHLDLDNEMSTVNVSAHGVVVPGAVLQGTKATLYKGATPAQGVSYIVESSPGNIANINTQGELTVVSIRDDVSVFTIKASVYDEDLNSMISRSTTYSVTKVYPGEDGEPGVSYWIVPSVAQIKKSADNLLNASTVSVDCYRQRGGSSVEKFVPSVPFVLKFRTSKMENEEVYTGPVAVTNTMDWVDLKLYNDNNILDYERVPIVSDGSTDLTPMVSTIFTADLDNEQVAVNCNQQGNVITAIPTTRVHLYKGAEEIPTSKIEYQVNSNVGTNAVVSGGLVTVSSLGGDANQVKITLKHTDEKCGEIVRTVVYSINKVHPGKDGSPAVSYELRPTASFIKKNSQGQLENNEVQCLIYKTVGDSAPVEIQQSAEVSLMYGTSSSIELKPYSDSVSADPNDTKITFILIVNGTVRDQEDIPVISDGINGEEFNPNYPGYSLDIKNSWIKRGLIGVPNNTTGLVAERTGVSFNLDCDLVFMRNGVLDRTHDFSKYYVTWQIRGAFLAFPGVPSRLVPTKSNGVWSIEEKSYKAQGAIVEEVIGRNFPDLYSSQCLELFNEKNQLLYRKFLPITFSTSSYFTVANAQIKALVGTPEKQGILDLKAHEAFLGVINNLKKVGISIDANNPDNSKIVLQAGKVVLANSSGVETGSFLTDSGQLNVQNVLVQKGDNFVRIDGSLGKLFASGAEISGTIKATQGWIGHFKIEQGFILGATNSKNPAIDTSTQDGGKYTTDRAVVCSDADREAFAAIGTNINPLSSGYPCTGRFECNQKGFIRNVALSLEAQGGFALNKSVALKMGGGCVQGLAYDVTLVTSVGKTKLSSDTVVATVYAKGDVTLELPNVNDYDDGHVVIVKNCSEHRVIIAPGKHTSKIYGFNGVEESTKTLTTNILGNDSYRGTVLDSFMDSCMYIFHKGLIFSENSNEFGGTWIQFIIPAKW